MQAKPLYLIVHESAVTSKSFSHVGGPNRIQDVMDEINRIKNSGKRGESWLTWDGDPSTVPPGLDRSRPIKLCGAYWTRAGRMYCINDMFVALEPDYDVEVHEQGTLETDNVF